jgi:hypothetical protein
MSPDFAPILSTHWNVGCAKFVLRPFASKRNKPELNSYAGIAWATMQDKLLM